VTDVLHDRLRIALAGGPALRIAILFGSRARGTARADSDVDVAILPASEDLSLAEEHALAADLERAAGAPVDLVRLDHASAALEWRVARDGVVLLSDPPQAAIRFRARAGIAHDEVRELEVDAMRRYRARLALDAEEKP
jgi:uncharacterized protein